MRFLLFFSVMNSKLYIFMLIILKFVTGAEYYIMYSFMSPYLKDILFLIISKFIFTYESQ